MLSSSSGHFERHDGLGSSVATPRSSAEIGAHEQVMKDEYHERVARWFYHNAGRTHTKAEILMACGDEAWDELSTSSPDFANEVEALGGIHAELGEQVLQPDGQGGERMFLEVCLVAADTNGRRGKFQGPVLFVPYHLTKEGTQAHVIADLKKQRGVSLES